MVRKSRETSSMLRRRRVENSTDQDEGHCEDSRTSPGWAVIALAPPTALGSLMAFSLAVQALWKSSMRFMELSLKVSER